MSKKKCINVILFFTLYCIVVQHLTGHFKDVWRCLVMESLCLVEGGTPLGDLGARLVKGKYWICTYGSDRGEDKQQTRWSHPRTRQEVYGVSYCSYFVVQSAESCCRETSLTHVLA